jgi:hypothetical protein
MKVLEENKLFCLYQERTTSWPPVRLLVTILTLEYFKLSGICCGGSVTVVVYRHCRHYGLLIFGVIPFTLHYN